MPQRIRSFVYQDEETPRALPSALVCTHDARHGAGEPAPTPFEQSEAKGMSYDQTEAAIDAHMKAYGLFTRAQRGGAVENLREFSAREFELRCALLEGRGNGTETEIKRLTYIVGFMIVSRVSGGERLAGETVGAH